MRHPTILGLEKMDTDLHDAAREGNLQRFIECSKQCADVNPENEKGETPLYLATYFGHLAVCEAIVQKIETVNPKPLYFAVDQEHTEIFKFLYTKSEDPNPKCEDGLTPLHAAARTGNVELFNLIFQF